MQQNTLFAPNNDQILEAFQELLSQQKHVGAHIATKQEAAKGEEDKKVVEKASTYTVESIVKGLADVQLNFGGGVDSLVEKLALESQKLEELRRAIQVETQHLEVLRNIRIAADALDILLHDHQAKTTAFAEKSQQEQQTLDKEIAEERQVWQKEQKEFDVRAEERQELLEKERTQREADHQYEVERKQKIEADEYTNRKTTVERKIAEEDMKRSADWAERGKILAEQQEALKKYRALVESFPQELEKTTQKAREEMIKEVNREAKIQAELFEKEDEASKQVYELKITSLQETIAQQVTQIEHLSAQLQAALTQVQDLAVKALNTGTAA